MAKDAKGHGSDKRGGGMPIPGHEYHTKTNAQLQYIAKDAAEAAKATRGMTMYDPNSHTRQDTEGKYLDQMNNAASVLGYRARGGTDYSPDGAAARELARGNPKADAAPIHPGATGRTDSGSGSWAENPSNPTNTYNRDVALRFRNGQVGSGMKFRG